MDASCALKVASFFSISIICRLIFTSMVHPPLPIPLMASRASLASAFLTCLILSFSFSTSSRILPSNSANASDKVSLGLYYETLCPFCANFIVNFLNDLVQDAELLSIVDLYLSPWGNARLNGSNTIVCQHGPEECLLNTVEACAIDSWPKLEDHFPFIYCIESLVFEDKDKEWESCFEKLGLDPKPVMDCYNNGRGKELELEYGAVTRALRPRKIYVPWVVVDGQPLYEDYKNYISYICKAYKGRNSPKACSQLSRNDSPKSNVKPQVCYKETTTLSDRTASATAFWMEWMKRAAST